MQTTQEYYGDVKYVTFEIPGGTLVLTLVRGKIKSVHTEFPTTGVALVRVKGD